MAGSRALPDLVTRIRVDSSGFDQAISHLIGSFGKADLALAGVAAGIGLLVIGGKSMIDSAEKGEKAENDLAQAVLAYNSSLGKTVASHVDVTKETKAHDAALRHLAEVEAGMPTKHKATQLELMHLEDAQKRVADTAAALAAKQETVGHTTEAAGILLSQYQDQIDEFIRSNRRYITDQSEVIDGFAKLTRSGLTQAEVQKDMNRAVDLAALKHISLSDAVQILDQAEHGRLKGLSDLGITTAKYTDAQGQEVASSHDVAKAMEELDQKSKGGRGTLTQLEQDTRQLNNDWQDLSKKGGPVLLTLLDNIAKGASGIYDWFDKIGHDDKLWATINDRLVKMASWIKQYVVDPLHQASDELNANPAIQQAYKNYQKNTSQMAPPGLQFGGSMLPNHAYTVGEDGPETAVMGASGGYVIPNQGGGRGGGDTFHFYQTQTDPWQTANEISWAKKTKRI